MTHNYNLARVAASLAGIALLAASAHVTISKSGGYGEATSVLILAVTVGLGAGAVALGAALSQKRRGLAVAILVCLLCGEAFALLQSGERIIATREAAQAPLREALVRHEAAAQRLAKAEAARAKAPATSPRLEAAVAAHAAAMTTIATEAAKPGCRKNCKDLLQAAADSAAKEVETARVELRAAADKATRDLEDEIAFARADLETKPKPASASALSERLGISAATLDLIAAALGALAVNGLASALLAFSAQGAQPDIVTPGSTAGDATEVEATAEPVAEPSVECAVCEWLSRATSRKVGNRVPIGEIYAAYSASARSIGEEPLNLTRFGRALTACNVGKERKGGKVLALDIEITREKPKLRVVA